MDEKKEKLDINVELPTASHPGGSRLEIRTAALMSAVDYLKGYSAMGKDLVIPYAQQFEWYLLTGTNFKE
jgi:hypothetical protein